MVCLIVGIIDNMLLRFSDYVVQYNKFLVYFRNIDILTPSGHECVKQ